MEFILEINWIMIQLMQKLLNLEEKVVGVNQKNVMEIFS